MNAWVAYFLGICTAPVLGAIVVAVLDAYERARDKFRRYRARRVTPRRCPHQHIRGIYGDEIMQSGWKRLRCTDCGRLLDGPVTLASDQVVRTEDVLS